MKDPLGVAKQGRLVVTLTVHDGYVLQYSVATAFGGVVFLKIAPLCRRKPTVVLIVYSSVSGLFGCEILVGH